MLVHLLKGPAASAASLVKVVEKILHISLSELDETERRAVKNVQNQA